MTTKSTFLPDLISYTRTAGSNSIKVRSEIGRCFFCRIGGRFGREKLFSFTKFARASSSSSEKKISLRRRRRFPSFVGEEDSFLRRRRRSPSFVGENFRTKTAPPIVKFASKRNQSAHYTTHCPRLEDGMRHESEREWCEKVKRSERTMRRHIIPKVWDTTVSLVVRVLRLSVGMWQMASGVIATAAVTAKRNFRQLITGGHAFLACGVVKASGFFRFPCEKGRGIFLPNPTINPSHKQSNFEEIW